MNCGLTACYEEERMLGGSYLCDCGLPGVFFCWFLELLCFTGEMGCDRIKALLQNRYYLLPCVMKADREYLSDKFI